MNIKKTALILLFLLVSLGTVASEKVVWNQNIPNDSHWYFVSSVEKYSVYCTTTTDSDDSLLQICTLSDESDRSLDIRQVTVVRPCDRSVLNIPKISISKRIDWGISCGGKSISQNTLSGIISDTKGAPVEITRLSKTIFLTN